ncbi:MAG: hypothetical protein WBL44_12905 [Nitrososphaeraceae archaeon]
MADNTCQLPEKTQRDAPVDSYIDVKEVCQNASFVVGVDSIVKNCSGNRRLETGQVSNLP